MTEATLVCPIRPPRSATMMTVLTTRRDGVGHRTKTLRVGQLNLSERLSGEKSGSRSTTRTFFEAALRILWWLLLYKINMLNLGTVLSGLKFARRFSPSQSPFMYLPFLVSVCVPLPRRYTRSLVIIPNMGDKINSSQFAQKGCHRCCRCSFIREMLRLENKGRVPP